MSLEEETHRLVGGYKIIRGERRFVVLTTKKKRTRHCKSCLGFRKGNGYYCIHHPEFIITPETEACKDYVNRTHKNR